MFLFLTVCVLFSNTINGNTSCNQNTIDLLANWISDCQINEENSNNLATHGIFAVSPNKSWIVPYFTNNGLRGFLRSNHPERYKMTRDWLDWYINNIDENGVMSDYTWDGINLNSSAPDSEDAYAASFWGLVYEYYQFSNDTSWFLQPNAKEQMELMADYLINVLQQDDGLAWAKQSYKIKYLMDNCQVYWGLQSLAKIETEIYNDIEQAEIYFNAASAVKEGIHTVLYDENTMLYKPHAGATDVDLSVWYPDAAALVFPQFYGVDDYCDPISVHLRQVLNENWDGIPASEKNWTNECINDAYCSPWAFIGYIYSKAGDTDLGFAQAEFIKNEKIDNGFPWIFTNSRRWFSGYEC